MIYNGIGGVTIEMQNVSSLAMQLICDIRKCASNPTAVDLLIETNQVNLEVIRKDPLEGHFFGPRIDAEVSLAKGCALPGDSK